MVCRWTGQYLYQPDDNEGKTTTDIVCNAVIAYVETYGSKHNLEIVTAVDKDSWSRHGKPIEVTTYSLKHGNEITPIEEVSEIMLAYYSSYMEDEASDFGRNAYYIGEPWSQEDLEVFVRETMIEYWS